MKFFPFSLLLFCAIHNIAQPNDTVNWKPDYKLRWIDFKGIPDSNSNNAAVTVTYIKYNIIRKDSFLDVIVYSYFDKSYSWGKYKKSKNILLHEQGHFDISELFARKFRQEVRVKRLKENSEIIVLYGKLMNDKKLYNLMYDTETDFSNNVKKQVYWRRKITHEIHLLDAYKN